MRKRKIIVLITMFLVCVLTACGNGLKTIRIGTGDAGGMYYDYSKRLSELLKNDFAFNLKVTMGSGANLRLLQKGFLDAAIVQSDTLQQAEEGTGIFAEATAWSDRAYSAVAGLYTESLQIVVRKDSGITCMEELKGKTVSLGEEESGVRWDAETLLNACGIKKSEVTRKYFSASEAAGALKEGTIDAFFYMAGAPTPLIGKLAEECEIRLLSLKEEEIRAFLALCNLGFRKCTIPADTYTGLSEEIQTIGVRAILVVANGMDESEVKKLTGKIFEHADELNRNLITGTDLAPETAAEDVPIPFHKGAAEYLKEKGIEVSAEESGKNGSVFGSQDEEEGTR
ncbi:MAG: TAXI family TRAP transporter solute-binding subunit [Eubacterium sp.]|nr:TAXI family TRAP transporter solute-binding subunit [Eubacterium sp.]